MENKTFKRTTVTSALPYANGGVHIGHLAGVYVPADIYVRYLRLKKREVLFIGGSDEHGVPITVRARKEGITPQDVVKRVGKEFQLVQMSCKAADKGKHQSEQLIATLKPTAADKTEYKPGIHEDIYLRMSVELPDKDTLKHPNGFTGKPVVSFAYSQDGKKFKPAGSPQEMRQGKWIGAKFGFIAAETDAKADRGWIDADWIRVTK